jgi:hypothetical protein
MRSLIAGTGIRRFSQHRSCQRIHRIRDPGDAAALGELPLKEHSREELVRAADRRPALSAVGRCDLRVCAIVSAAAALD